MFEYGRAMNKLFYGDNLQILRDRIARDSVDLCYIDPPFNSKRNYNQIYNNIGEEDRAQAQAFIDTWIWDDMANEGYNEIITNPKGRFQVQLVELIKGLHGALHEGSLLAYLVSMALRITEIQRVLKPDGSFFLHCDPTSSHYLKLVLDSVFCPQGGNFINEIAWCYSQGGKSKKWFAKKHDIIFWYSKSDDYRFYGDAVRLPLTPHKQDKSGQNYGGRMGVDTDGRRYVEKWGTGKKKLYRYYLDQGKIPEDWWIDINSIQADAKERLGYPTQKPEALLERIIKACSVEGDTVLDAYGGCGTTIYVAELLKRKWVGIDITYQSIALVLRRLEKAFGSGVLDNIQIDGIPKDMASAQALAHKKDDRLRKEFEKWAVLTYTNNRAVINEKKGGDRGIDGTAYFKTGATDSAKILLSVKSGAISPNAVRDLRGTVERDKAALGRLITLEEPTAGMRREAKSAGVFRHDLMGRNYDKIEIVTVQQMLESDKRLEIPMSEEVLRSAELAAKGDQFDLKLSN
jgi:DNA modification methylase